MRLAALAAALLAAGAAAAVEVPVPPERPAGLLKADRAAAHMPVERPANLVPVRPPAARAPGAGSTVALPPRRPTEAAAPESPADAAPESSTETPAETPTERELSPETAAPAPALPAAAPAPERPAEALSPVRPEVPSTAAATAEITAPKFPASAPGDELQRRDPTPAAAVEARAAEEPDSPFPRRKPVAKPEPEPERMAMTAATGREAIVCDDPRIVGKRKPMLVGNIAGCVIGDPVEITRISGIRLSTPATLDCNTARTFANWLTGVADPAAREMLGSKIARVWVMGSYSCRTRNNLRGTRLSEHAAGRAVDVGGFTLKDGRKVRVLAHWNRGDQGKFLKTIWTKACGPFTTVLGPNGDRFHRDHIHVDTAPRSGSFCR